MCNKEEYHLRVADFFCGAGGFSEGFRQAGFEMAFAVDRWQPAIDTYKANKPNCTVVKDDIIRISTLSDDEFHALVPNTEVIIGSPPCVAFSSSNKSGKGDKIMGLKLLTSYFRIVARKRFMPNSQLKFWVLENVPNIQKYIKNEYSAADLELPGDFVLHVINESAGVYNAKYFGAPTNRKRFLCGEFPTPTQTHTDENVVTMRTVIDSLGEPCCEGKTIIEDCNYPGFSMNSDDVTDHQYLSVLEPFEWETAKRLKQDKGYMGLMSFPENVDRPARTVMATMSSSSRESMILGMADNAGYRMPTVRETASFMSFPIDYRFYGPSKGTKHTLVGNAVPPKLSYAVAKAIACNEGMLTPNQYTPIQHDASIAFYNLNNIRIPAKVELPRRDVAKFKYHIPYLILSSYRVELTNYHSDFSNKKFVWNAEIHYGQGKGKAQIFTPKISLRSIPAELRPSICDYCVNMASLGGANAFQRRFCMTSTDRAKGGFIGPYELLRDVRTFIDNNVPKNVGSELIDIKQAPFSLPLSILVGYYILCKITKPLGG